MRGVVAVALALLVSTVASGCFVEDKDPQTQDTGTTQTATSSGTTGPRTGTTTTTTGSASGNTTADRAPVANLTADTLNGTAPLNVTFAVDGSDPDGGALDWILTFGNTTLGTGNGTTLPANVTHSFTEAGNFTVVLTVTDGAGNATANVTVVVLAGTPAGPAGPKICEAPSETSIGGQMYVDRISWIFRESNGLPGLQYTAKPSLIGEVDAAGAGCENGDTLLF